MQPSWLVWALHVGYDKLRTLFHLIRQAEKAHSFYYGYSADEIRANQQLEHARIVAQEVLDHVDKTLETINEYQSKSHERKK